MIQIEVPPLRERCDDVPALFRYFMCVQAARLGRPVAELTSDALSCLTEYDWPGNVRELKELADRLAQTTHLRSHWRRRSASGDRPPLDVTHDGAVGRLAGARQLGGPGLT